MKQTEDVRVYLAPMAGVTDAAMRQLCIEQGAQLAFTEMVSAKAVSYGNEKSQDLLMPGEHERIVGVQLFGREPRLLADTARSVQDTLAEQLHTIDINMGCPAPKIVNNGEGCALMREPVLAGEIISAVRDAVDVCVSVKIRAGFDAEHVNAVEFARMAEQAGAQAVTVHGRTREQYYAGRADWDIIRDVRRNVGIKVIGNGDIFQAADAVAMMRHTGCDAVMVARGAHGNPFLFAQICELLQYGEVRTVPTVAQRIGMCLRQARMTMETKGERMAILQMRTHAPHYVKGLKNAAKLRNRLVKVEKYTELQEILHNALAFLG